MGQYFNFYNLDKRQQLSPPFGNKMGEFFFSGYPSEIIMLLAIPEAGSDEYLGRDPVSWAGDRIICVGDYVDDWPDNVLSADDCKSLESPNFLYSNSVEISHRNIPEAPTYSGSGVLRNLSKKIYVLAEGIPAICSCHKKLAFIDPPPPIDTVPGLGSVLLSRVGWSADPSAAMSWKDADTLTSGEWAGDRFDVRSYDEVKEELESGDWINATEAEAKRTKSLWKSDGFAPYGWHSEENAEHSPHND